MYDIRNAQRSFNNSWALSEQGDFPSGVILDIAVTTPLSDPVYIAKATEDDGYLSLSLKQGSTEIAYMRTSKIGIPVRLTSITPGVWASAILGYIPAGLHFIHSESSECIISPMLVTNTSQQLLSELVAGSKLTITKSGSKRDYNIRGDVHIEFDYPITANLNGGSLSIDIIDGSLNQTTADTEDLALLTSVNGLTPANAFSITIKDRNGLIFPAYGQGDSIVVLESRDKNLCQAVDKIDDYIYPTSGYKKVLDICYEATEGGFVRNTAKLLPRDGREHGYQYGWSYNQGLDIADPSFDRLDCKELEGYENGDSVG